MYPGFNIYQSILSGSWQPALPSNREAARFDNLLQGVRFDNACRCRSFFQRVAALSGDPQRRNRKAFHPEALRLAGICGCGGSNVFLSLPAAGSRERFYNLLTGYSLQNYEQWISRLLHDNCSKETGKWMHYRLVDRLHALLHLDIPAYDMPTEVLLIACRVKAAAAILMHRLMNGMPVKDNGFHNFLWPREELKSALAACDLALSARREVIGLYDNATGMHGIQSPGYQYPASPGHAANNAPNIQLQDDHPLIKLYNAFKEDSKSIRRQAKKILDKNNRQESIPDDAVPRRVDTTTACSILGISKKSLQRLRDNKELPFINFGGKYFYLLDDINALLLKRNNNRKPGSGNQHPSC